MGIRKVCHIKVCQISLTQLDGDVSFEFILESNRMHTRDGLDHCRLAVRYMSNCANIDGGLTRNHLRRLWSQLCDILEIF